MFIGFIGFINCIQFDNDLLNNVKSGLPKSEIFLQLLEKTPELVNLFKTEHITSTSKIKRDDKGFKYINNILISKQGSTRDVKKMFNIGIKDSDLCLMLKMKKFAVQCH